MSSLNTSRQGDVELTWYVRGADRSTFAVAAVSPPFQSPVAPGSTSAMRAGSNSRPSGNRPVRIASRLSSLFSCATSGTHHARGRLRSAQRVVLGDGQADLVAHAASLQDAFELLHARVEEVADRMEDRMAAAEDRLDGAIAYRALVRYDAYGEMSGHQSTSLALLDADHNGVVLSSIAHRDTARLYCKQVHAGRGEHQLSPEEEEAVRLALAGEAGSVTLGH